MQKYIFQIFFILLLIHNTYTQFDEYCRAVDGQGKCNQCAMSFLNDQQICEEVPNKIDNCLSYMKLDDRVTCKLCRYGYQLNDTLDQCNKIVLKNCLMAADEDCLVCTENIQVDNGDCQKNNTIHIPNCMLSTGSIEDPQCMRCEPEHILKVDELNQTICVPTQQTNDNCSMLVDNDQCFVCEFNYYMTSDRKCLKSSKYSVDLFDNVSKVMIYLFTFLCFY